MSVSVPLLVQRGFLIFLLNSSVVTTVNDNIKLSTICQNAKIFSLNVKMLVTSHSDVCNTSMALAGCNSADTSTLDWEYENWFIIRLLF